MPSLVRLRLTQPLPWLQPSSLQDPLILLPGEGSQVSFETSMLLSTSPLLRTLVTSPSCSCSPLTVILPSVTCQVKPALFYVR